MLKKTISLIVMILIAFGFSINANAQDDTRVIWEYMMITPDKAHLKTLGENMGKHNQKYHSEGPYQAYVFNVRTGDDMGKLIWQMGPLKFSDLDGRPSDNGHDDDWRDNIMPYIKHMTNGEYWRTNTKYSLLENMDPNSVTHPLLVVRFKNVNKGKGYQVGNIQKNVKAAIQQIENHSPWGVYSNLFQQGENGRHIAWVRFLKTWGELDGPGKFKAAFIKANGESSWEEHLRAVEDTFSDSWDVIFEYNAKLSGQ